MYLFPTTVLKSVPGCPYQWHGGSPTHDGSCWCGWDTYCLCTPSLAIDAVIEYKGSNERDTKIVLIQRRDSEVITFAIPGGFVDVGEAVEAAAVREVKEETNLDLTSLQQFKVFSDPKRDARRHTVSVVFRCFVEDVTDIHSGDDAKAAVLVPLREALKLKLAFDHKVILEEFIKHFHPTLLSM
eukprot:CAMPEP_0185029198 /NCGR_PEP_ID=MMETSP1103-20130426/15362_1 /TAXON_ID=36769 /ORGANISM="Paraphysomonas bandaiensis, Strain Caron Lab Isolate" /LENGTH=183 /DNA_ID=CAMNT_0027563857 /DNA_START=135 /DNA_END=686 /DNA_ORIENTATION=+